MIRGKTVCLTRILCSLFSPLLLASLAASAITLPEVPAPRRAVTNTYHGTSVFDEYQVLENAAAPEVRQWTRLQNERARAYFDSLPFRSGIAQQLTQIRMDESARYFGLDGKTGRLFALRFKPPAQQPVLIRLSSLDAPALWQPVFDPNTYDTNGTTTIDWYVPSPDGRLVAICLSQGRSEHGTLHVFDVDTGKKRADEISRVHYPTAGGSATWTADGTGIFYTRYPHAGGHSEADINSYQQVWFHRLGTPTS